MALSTGARLLAALPDLSVSLLFLTPAFSRGFMFEFAPWVEWIIPAWLRLNTETLLVIASMEVILIWPQMTLVGIATRVLKRPNPFVIAVVLLLVGWLMGAFSPETWHVSPTHFLAVTLPILLSIWQRVQMLWTLPGKPKLDLFRARAIMAGRFNIAIAVAAPPFLYELVRGVLETAAGINRGPMILSVTHPAPYLMVAIYFMLTSFDQWRVGGAAFARRPRAFLRLDLVDVTGADDSS